jgi:hypothetical protein
MKTPDAHRRHLRIALLCGFVLAGAYSLHESYEILVLVYRSFQIDKIAPHLGDAELPDEHQHALHLYPYTLLALCFAYCLYLTRPAPKSLEK